MVGEGGVEYRGNSAGGGYAVQGSCVVIVVLWEWELGDDGGHAKRSRGIPSLGSKNDYGDDGMTYDEQGVVVSPGGWSSGYLWAMSNQVLYTAEAGHRSGTGGPPANIWALHRGREDAKN